MKTDLQVKHEHLSIQKPKIWSQSDQILLLQLKRRMIPIEEIALCLERTVSSCTTKLNRLKHHPINPNVSIHRPHFQKADIEAAIQLLAINKTSNNTIC
jgi:hypothetical protein